MRFNTISFYLSTFSSYVNVLENIKYQKMLKSMYIVMYIFHFALDSNVLWHSSGSEFWCSVCHGYFCISFAFLKYSIKMLSIQFLWAVVVVVVVVVFSTILIVHSHGKCLTCLTLVSILLFIAYAKYDRVGKMTGLSHTCLLLV